jgi:hypothetical protein
VKLARLMDPVAFEDRANPKNLGQSWDQYSRRQAAMDHATLALIRGYRRLVEDDDTVDRAAEVRALSKTLEASREHAQRARREGLDEDTCRFWSGVSGFLRSRIRALEAGEEPDWPDAADSSREDLDDTARAAVRALREDTQDVELCQGCGNPSNEGLHGMSEYGGCV